MIDDERWPSDARRDKLLRLARSSDKAKTIVEAFGIPSEIWFDHDLGGDDTSRKFIAWLGMHMLDNDLNLPSDFIYSVHSQNPVGKKNIEADMKEMIQYFGEGV